mmetsp:Transcript_119182/g.254267  ORF Transcript_119182/g.254267 Transcript_119182/m.254267 type:complete len:281 (+) Transcript_119182:351-1193(+)
MEHGYGQASPGKGHGECGAALAVLRLHNLSACVLDVLVQVGDLVRRDCTPSRILGKQGKDRGARMAANDRYINGIDGRTCDLVHKLVRPKDVERSDTDDLLRIEATLLPELTHCRHHTVHGVHDEADNSIWAKLGTSLHDVLGDVGIDEEQILAVLPRLPRHASRDHDEVTTCEALSGLLDVPIGLVEGVGSHLGLPVDVRQVRSDAAWRHHCDGQVHDTKLSDIGVGCQKHAQWLANTARTTHHTDLEVPRLFGARQLHRTSEASHCYYRSNQNNTSTF